MAKRILWLSQHRLLEVQEAALRERFGKDVVIETDSRPFDDAADIVQRFREGKYDEIVVVAPISVLQKLLELGVQPFRSIMKDKKFQRFRRMTEISIKYEDDRIKER